LISDSDYPPEPPMFSRDERRRIERVLDELRAREYRRFRYGLPRGAGRGAAKAWCANHEVYLRQLERGQ